MPTDQQTALTGLFVAIFNHELDDGTIHPPSWCVMLRQSAVRGHGTVVSGFASKRDAEIGMASLNATDIPWNADIGDVIAHVTAFGGMDELRRCAVQNLRW